MVGSVKFGRDTGIGEKIIYVRDIYKQYYVRGINSSINSIDELCKF